MRQKMISLLLVFLLLTAPLLAGCGEEELPAQAEVTGGTTADFATNDGEMFTERDRTPDYDESAAVTVTLTGEGATASSDAVVINGTTLLLTAEATYLISGQLDNGRLVVDAPKEAKIQLVFDGVSIHSESHAPLYIIGCDKVFLTLKEGSINSLSNGGSFTAEDENNVDGALFSKQDLTVNGAGSLSVSSPAGHGIVCKDDLVLTGGSLTVSAAGHGIDANDSVRMANAALELTAGKDGIHAENSEDATLGFVYISSGSLTATAAGDGIDAGAHLQIAAGTLTLTAGGNTAGDSTKGLKAASGILIEGGSIRVSSADDCVHSNASVFIKGGDLELDSSDDGVHADALLEITAGSIRIAESYEGLEALNIVVAGGDISLTATDDGLNAAGGTDQSGYGGPGGGNDRFEGGGPGGPGGRPRSGGAAATSGSGSIEISGGTLRIKASGDGIDANGTLSITGGYITVCGPTQGDTATLDYDVSGTISGGTFIGTGASGMAQTFSESPQGVIALRVGNQSAGTPFVLTDSAGNVLIEHTPELSYAVVILSSPDIVKGESYTITVGGLSGSFEAS